jgi:hypothetical protein
MVSDFRGFLLLRRDSVVAKGGDLGAWVDPGSTGSLAEPRAVCSSRQVRFGCNPPLAFCLLSLISVSLSCGSDSSSTGGRRGGTGGVSSGAGGGAGGAASGTGGTPGSGGGDDRSIGCDSSHGDICGCAVGPAPNDVRCGAETVGGGWCCATEGWPGEGTFCQCLPLRCEVTSEGCECVRTATGAGSCSGAVCCADGRSCHCFDDPSRSCGLSERVSDCAPETMPCFPGEQRVSRCH